MQILWLFCFIWLISDVKNLISVEAIYWEIQIHIKHKVIIIIIIIRKKFLSFSNEFCYITRKCEAQIKTSSQAGVTKTWQPIVNKAVSQKLTPFIEVVDLGLTRVKRIVLSVLYEDICFMQNRKVKMLIKLVNIQ